LRPALVERAKSDVLGGGGGGAAYVRCNQWLAGNAHPPHLAGNLPWRDLLPTILWMDVSSGRVNMASTSWVARLLGILGIRGGSSAILSALQWWGMPAESWPTQIPHSRRKLTPTCSTGWRILLTTIVGSIGRLKSIWKINVPCRSHCGRGTTASSANGARFTRSAVRAALKLRDTAAGVLLIAVVPRRGGQKRRG